MIQARALGAIRDIKDLRVYILVLQLDPDDYATKRVSGSSAAGSEVDDIVTEVSIKDPPHIAYPYDFVDNEDSPYPEMHASVSNIDDPEMLVSTFHMWIIGLILCILASGMNMFFMFRYLAPSVMPMVLLTLFLCKREGP
ncbi:hypothetical protein BOTBODRAFT_168501 [Botryobasidium botryosum FD-172 SS1]|uniref:Uncharacterized protein n=1 Tax=Botryobasidium botryosum (strain FD-172 SS1) TaxID=930990 RepID=A0A067NAL2_BOTB1|nr:hypothetical protein BOTBODRAFT_168501 [Botryobasidium botryosum FD-172 SS1]